MPRFVILHHCTPPGYARATHYDLMLEWDALLRTWAIEQPPSASKQDQLAEQLADHRLAYLEYEGQVSNGRGDVTRWDEGDYELTTSDELQLAVELCGRRLQGTLRLSRRTSQEQAWQLHWIASPGSES